MAYNDPNLLEALLSRLYQELNRCDTAREVAWAITQQMMPFLALDDCVVYLADAEQQWLKQAAAFGPKQRARNILETQLTLAFGQGIVGTAAATQQVQLINDTRADPRYLVDMEQRGSELAVPIIFEGRVYAVLDSEHRQVGFYQPEHVQVFSTIAFIAAPFFARFARLLRPS